MPGPLKTVLTLMGVGAFLSAGMASLILLATTVLRDEMIVELGRNPELRAQFDTAGIPLEMALGLSVVAIPLGLVSALPIGVAMVLLFRPEVRQWFM